MEGCNVAISFHELALFDTGGKYLVAAQRPGTGRAPFGRIVPMVIRP
jgi:hypothetical protein